MRRGGGKSSDRLAGSSAAVNAAFVEQAERFEATKAGQTMRATRAKLPAFNARDELLTAIARHQVCMPAVARCPSCLFRTPSVCAGIVSTSAQHTRGST